MKRSVLLVSIALFLAMVGFFWDYSMDDAFITYRYAENLAEGHGLVFNPTDQPVEGYSNFLWLLLLSLVHLVGLPIYLSAKIIGVICLLLAGVLWFRQYESHDKPVWLAGPLFLIAPIAAFWGVSGLELGLHCLLIVAATIYVGRNSKWLNLILPLIVISRPEGAAICLGLVLASALVNRAAGRPFMKSAFTSTGVILVAVLALTVFRLQVFGYPLPNTYYAKAHGGFLPGLAETVRMLLYFAPLTIGLLWGVRRILATRFKEAGLVIWIAPVLVQILASSSVNPVMNVLFRYMVPLMPLLLAVAIVAATSFGRPLFRRLALALIVVSLFAAVPQSLEVLAESRRVVAAQESFIEWSEQLPRFTTISMTDMGRIPYYTGLHYNDLWGLVDQETAHEGFNVDREMSRLPDYFVFVGYLGAEECELLFGHEQMISWRENSNLYYYFLRACAPVGVNPSDSGYNYLVFKRTPQAKMLFGR